MAVVAVGLLALELSRGRTPRSSGGRLEPGESFADCVEIMPADLPASRHALSHTTTLLVDWLGESQDNVLQAPRTHPETSPLGGKGGVGRLSRPTNAYVLSQPTVLSRSTRISEEATGTARWHVPGPIPTHIIMVQTEHSPAISSGAPRSPRPSEVNRSRKVKHQ